MELLDRRGLDVHKETVVACLRLGSEGQGDDRSSYLAHDHGGPVAVVGAAGGQRLHACGHEGDWHLVEAGLHILDDGEFELVLANAALVKNVPGRKTDVNAAKRLAELMAYV